MQTSRFQLGLIATLAVGLGFSLSSSDAIGYPAGAAVSLGSNPLWSKGGILTDSLEVVVTAPVGLDAVVTDVVLTYADGNCHPRVEMKDDAGEVLASFILFLNQDSDKTAQPTNIQHAFKSGISVASGESLSMSQFYIGGPCNEVNYTISGYYAQP